MRAAYEAHLSAELAAADTYTVPREKAPMLGAQWGGMVWPGSSSDNGLPGTASEDVNGDSDAQDVVVDADPDTGVDVARLRAVGRASVAVPDGFAIHPRLQRHVKHRLQAVDAGEKVDWATAEVRALPCDILMFDARMCGAR